ncbi:MAG: hypothetical protein A2X36_03075 [Elusimicrobia bacterium GWA2_69_24]|nr:MAG: hypothetical protein A2X36_03075 [Elusimicrobia bacterium GWA2_69_24]HBL19229.1 hypothetical protein [Elusimicrobiota bacterium]
MAITKLDHVSLLAPQPGPVLDFYRDLLGFELSRKREFPDAGMNIYDLKRGGDFVELIEPTAPGAAAGGIKHLAFLSDDIDADFAAFRGQGAALVHAEVQRHGDCAFFFVKGPAGEFVEIIQYGGGKKP